MVTYWHDDGVLIIIPMSAPRFRIIDDFRCKGSTVVYNGNSNQRAVSIGIEEYGVISRNPILR